MNIQGLRAVVRSNAAPHSPNDQALTLRMGRVTWVKGINSMVMGGNSIFGGEHVGMCTEVEIQCAHEMYSVTNQLPQ